jgi:hypothetical protein
MTRALWILWKREVGAILHSPIAWVLMTCMALINGFSFSQCVAYLGQGVKEFTVMQGGGGDPALPDRLGSDDLHGTDQRV